MLEVMVGKTKPRRREDGVSRFGALDISVSFLEILNVQGHLRVEGIMDAD